MERSDFWREWPRSTRRTPQSPDTPAGELRRAGPPVQPLASESSVNPLAFLLGPIQFELTQRALVEATLVSVACGVLGVLVVQRGLSFISDALSHCVVPGVVAAFLTHANRELGGTISALIAAWAMLLLRRRGALGSDPSIAVVFTTMFAFGLALISATGSYLNDLTEILFGAILATSPGELLASGAVATVVLAGTVALFWPLVLVSFDPVAARAQGLPVDRIELAFYGLLALAVVSGLVAVGSMLVTGLLIVPATTARILARRVATQMVVSGLIGCVASWIGLYTSYYLRIASGGAIVLAAALIFAVALLAAPRQGIVARLLHRPRRTETVTA
ncbi:MAG: manganese ABC transporter permease [Chloroflexi bacterium]|nr:manganese ABC transporter permease [Chloroflexota bacterium]